MTREERDTFIRFLEQMRDGAEMGLKEDMASSIQIRRNQQARVKAADLVIEELNAAQIDEGR